MFYKLVLISLAWALFGLNTLAFGQAHSSDGKFSVEQLHADFHQLYQTLQTAHIDLYANITKREYDLAFANYLAQINSPMSAMQARLHFQRFVALGKVAHAKLDLPIAEFREYRARGGVMLPLFVKIDGETVYVDEVVAQQTGAFAGYRLTHLNGQPIDSWISAMRAMISADNQQIANTLLEMQFPFLLWLLDGEQNNYTVTLVNGSESTVLTIATLSRSQQDRIMAERDVTTTNTLPREAKLLTEKIAYLKPGPFYNIDDASSDVWDNRPFISFVDNAFQEFIKQDVKALLIDLRDNPGGTNSFSDPMLSWFAHEPFRFASDFIVKVSPQAIAANQARLVDTQGDKSTSEELAEFYQRHAVGDSFSLELPLAKPREREQFKGLVFVLVDRYTYSNAVSVAAIAQDYSFATVLGEKTADLATTFGAMEHFILDHSGFEVAFPKALIVRPSGDKRHDGVAPDIELSAVLERRDQDVLAEAVEHIQMQVDK